METPTSSRNTTLFAEHFASQHSQTWVYLDGVRSMNGQRKRAISCTLAGWNTKEQIDRDLDARQIDRGTRSQTDRQTDGGPCSLYISSHFSSGSESRPMTHLRGQPTGLIQQTVSRARSSQPDLVAMTRSACFSDRKAPAIWQREEKPRYNSALK
jgi:hypothetical protein